MKLMQWEPGISDSEAKEVAYWERNMLALRFADGWYNDDIPIVNDDGLYPVPFPGFEVMKPRFFGWRRVLSLDGGKITFHIPDDFDVGTLPQMERNWDGHTTAEKWQRIASMRSVVLEVE